MEKSFVSNQNRTPSITRQTRLAPITPVLEIMTPPPTKSMVAPNSGASQPTETSVSSTYLKMGKFVLNDKMSEVFSKMAERFKEEESQGTPIPIGTPIKELIPPEPAAQYLGTSTTFQTQTLVLEAPRSAGDLKQNTEIRREVEFGEEGHDQEKRETDGGKERKPRKPVGKEPARKELEVVNVEEIESGDDWETLSESATRRSFRTQRGLDREELRSMRVEAAVLAATKKEARYRKRKEKGVINPSKNRKLRPASLGVVIREVVASPTRSLHYQEEEQHIGALERK